MIVQDNWTILQINDECCGKERRGVMDSTNRQTPEREAQKVQAKREELIERLMRALPEDGAAEPLEGLLLSRASAPTELSHSLFFPAFCVIAQGCKEILLGNNRYWYEPARYLIGTAELPIASRITEASLERPYLNVILKLDSRLVSSVMVEAGHGAPLSQSLMTAIDVSPLDAGLLDAVLRLVSLLDSPSDARFLAPMVTREIVYRLLKGEQRGRLAHIAALGSNTQRITEAITRLRNEFNRPLRIEEVARELGMSVSSFHQHFKTLTAMSPLQFQKQLRLQEARRLMLGEGLDVATAGYRVGYDDASYFNREYKKLFGAPPLRDVERLREDTRERVVGQGTV
jgi:AraC-like DNA-binding protein